MFFRKTTCLRIRTGECDRAIITEARILKETNQCFLIKYPVRIAATAFGSGGYWLTKWVWIMKNDPRIVDVDRTSVPTAKPELRLVS